MPDLDAKEVRERLGNRKRGFAWLKREIGAKQQQEIYRLGLPGSASSTRTSAPIRMARRSRT